jgi:hypothetical protein
VNVSNQDTITCLAGQVINYTISCTSESPTQQHNVSCTGVAETVLIECEGSYQEPACLLYDGNSFIDTGCIVHSYTASNTTCTCSDLNALCGLSTSTLTESTAIRTVVSSIHLSAALHARTAVTEGAGATHRGTIEYGTQTKGTHISAIRLLNLRAFARSCRSRFRQDSDIYHADQWSYVPTILDYAYSSR